MSCGRATTADGGRQWNEAAELTAPGNNHGSSVDKWWRYYRGRLWRREGIGRNKRRKGVVKLVWLGSIFSYYFRVALELIRFGPCMYSYFLLCISINIYASLFICSFYVNHILLLLCLLGVVCTNYIRIFSKSSSNQDENLNTTQLFFIFVILICKFINY